MSTTPSSLKLDTSRDRAPFQQTAIGELPVDWDVKNLGDLGQVVRGGSPRPAGAPRFFNGSFIPWLTVASLTNIPEHQLSVSETVGFLTEEGSKRSRVLHPGTLIIANSGATLGVAKLLQVTCCANDGIAAIIEQRSGDKVFLCHFINTQTERLREVIATGNGQPNLNTALIREIAVPFPPLPEQRAIAAALSDVDELIGALEKLIAKKRAIKLATMQQLLTGKTRLPGFEKTQGYKSTEAGLIPEDWRTTRLGDCGEVIMGQSPPSASYNRVGLGSPLINGPTEFTKRCPIKIQWTTQPARFCRAGDLLICVRGSSTGRTNYSDDKYAIGRGVAAIRATDGNNTEYLSYQVISGVAQILAAATGSTFPSVDGASFRKLTVLLPAPREQDAIAAVLSDMDAEITALEQRRDKTKAIKQGMMQQLLTGKIRLVPTEAEA